MDIKTVHTAIQQTLVEIGVSDCDIEISTADESGITHFDIQRHNVHGEELWFCFRIALSSDFEQFAIIRRVDFTNHRIVPDWSVLASCETALRGWLKQRFGGDNHLINELTRP